jgi:hypothetical protein
MGAGQDDMGTTTPHPFPMDTAAVLGDAMTDYVLCAGTDKAPAAGAPECMSRWLHARGYRIVRTSGRGRPTQGTDGRGQVVTLGWGCVGTDGAYQCAVLRQLRAAVGAIRPNLRGLA